MSFLAMEGGSQKCFDTSTRNHPIGGNRYQIHSLIHKLLNVITTHFWITTRAAQAPFCRKFGFVITHFFKSFSDKNTGKRIEEQNVVSSYLVPVPVLLFYVDAVYQRARTTLERSINKSKRKEKRRPTK